MSSTSFEEINFDGLVGPTHHYAGLAFGNLASISNALKFSNPREAALQGLAKMRFLHKLGIKQALLPPHPRPNLALLRQLGFCGKPETQIRKAFQAAPQLLSACYSASNMWAANAATVSSSLDTADHKLHFTSANLLQNLHRHQEALFTAQVLRRIFADDQAFVHHPPLPCTTLMSDEGAANHMRLCATHSHPGINLFVYGKSATTHITASPSLYPARQTFEASQAIARLHGLDEKRTFFACQNPQVIDQGVFHNDVIAVSHESFLFLHQEAFVNQREILQTLKQKADFELSILEVPTAQLTVQEAVKTYLFNSQIIRHPQSHELILIAPSECQTYGPVQRLIQEIIQDPQNPLSTVYFFDLRQSMQNGGGPACLRLRVPLSNQELAKMASGILIQEQLLQQLEQWIHKHYRDKLQVQDLADPSLMTESFSALDELSQILNLGSIYTF